MRPWPELARKDSFWKSCRVKKSRKALKLVIILSTLSIYVRSINNISLMWSCFTLLYSQAIMRHISASGDLTTPEFSCVTPSKALKSTPVPLLSQTRISHYVWPLRKGPEVHKPVMNLVYSCDGTLIHYCRHAEIFEARHQNPWKKRGKGAAELYYIAYLSYFVISCLTKCDGLFCVIFISIGLFWLGFHYQPPCFKLSIIELYDTVENYWTSLLHFKMEYRYISSRSKELLELENQYSAGGLDPLPAFISRGKGVKIWVSIKS